MTFFGRESRDKANNYRIQEMLSGEAVSQGENRHVIISPRNSVFKIDERTKNVSEAEQEKRGRDKWVSDTIGELSGADSEMESVMWAYRDTEDYSTLEQADQQTEEETPEWLKNMQPGEEVQIVEMRRAPISHGEAVEQLGIQQVIEKDVGMFQRILHNDLEIYFDFKHQNIGYFPADKDEQFFAAPIDLYDTDSFAEIDDSSAQIARSMGLYLRGNEVYTGVAEEYGLPLQEAEEYVFDALGLEKQKANGKPYKDILRAFN